VPHLAPRFSYLFIVYVFKFSLHCDIGHKDVHNEVKGVWKEPSMPLFGVTSGHFRRIEETHEKPHWLIGKIKTVDTTNILVFLNVAF